MAKQKTKTSVFDTVCTETSPGVWEWQTSSDIKWMYKDKSIGLNLFKLEDTVTPQGCFKNLEGAIYYSWGYHYGMDYATT